MEVDRVSQMGGVGRDNVPAWPKATTRRRKFVEEIPEPETEEPGEDRVAETNNPEPDQPEPGEDRGGSLDVMA